MSDYSVNSTRDFLQRPLGPTWDITKSYNWNFINGPIGHTEIPPWPLGNSSTKFIDFTLNSPLGIVAGPLLNSKWIKFYSRLGFDILTYKTIRTRAWPAYPLPNIIFIEKDKRVESDNIHNRFKISKKPKDISQITITNSFGMPSAAPEFWREDIRVAKKLLKKGQILIVSVVGTYDDSKNIKALADDFALCATWAVDAGADIIEANLSCPNIESQKTELYLDPHASFEILKAIREKIGDIPLAIKIGEIQKKESLYNLLSMIGRFIDMVVAINAIGSQIVDESGNRALKGRSTAGICGALIKENGLRTVRELVRLRSELGLNFGIMGCGGIFTPSHVKEYLSAGASTVGVATAAIWNPKLALQFAIASSESKKR